MTKSSSLTSSDQFQIRLLLEELLCDVARFQHWEKGHTEESLRIRQEVRLNRTGFADVLVEGPVDSYFIEVDFGYTQERIRESIRRKYSDLGSAFESVSRLVVVIDDLVDADSVRSDLAAIIPQSWEVELWDERHLSALVQSSLRVTLPPLTSTGLQRFRATVDVAKGKHAFGDTYQGDALDDFLLWALPYWQLQEFYAAAGKNKTEILNAETYSEVTVVFADLSGFSSYMRDTPDPNTISECLSAFCAKSRYQILNDGGFVYQFLGDAVIGIFGLPASDSGSVDRALACSKALLTIGDSISNEWQRQIDRIQSVAGAHIGVATGELQLLRLRPFSRTHLGAVGDTINIAARLSSEAGPGQIVLGNAAYRHLKDAAQAELWECEPVSAKNVGTIKAWRYDQAIQPPE